MAEHEELDWLEESRQRKRKKKNKSNKTGAKRKKSEVENVQKLPEVPNDNNHFECDICSKEFPKVNLLALHKKNFHSTTELKCDLCPYTTHIKKYLSKHVRTNHKKIRPIKCKYCPKTFEFQCKMEYHLLVHTGEKPFECEVCGKAFNTTYSLNTHRYIHTNEKPFKCEYCPYACRDSSTLRKHHNMHKGGSLQAYQCTACGLKLKCKRNLKMHVAERHLNLDVRLHPCTTCELRFKDKSALTVHVKSVHLKANSVTCDICCKRISQRSNLVAHMRTHDNVREFACAIQGCHKEFKTKADLKKHVIIHYPERHTPCDICGKKFAREKNMRDHLIKIHGPPRKRRKQFTLPNPKPPPKPLGYQCDSCGFLSGNKPGLISHMKRQEQTCNICNNVFCSILRFKKHFDAMHAPRPPSWDVGENSYGPLDKAEMKEEPPDDAQSIDLFEIEKEEQLEDLFYAGSDVDDDDSELSEAQEIFKRIEESHLSVDIVDIPEAVFDQIYSENVEPSDKPLEEKANENAMLENCQDKSLNVENYVTEKAKSFIDTPKIVNKHLENVKRLEGKSAKQRISDHNNDTNNTIQGLDNACEVSDGIEKLTVKYQNSEQVIEKQTLERSTGDQLETAFNKEVEETLTKESIEKHTMENLNSEQIFVKDNLERSTDDQLERDFIGEVVETSTKEINLNDDTVTQESETMEDVNVNTNEENGIPVAKLELKQSHKKKYRYTKANINKSVKPQTKSLDPELEDISKEEAAEIIKLNVCNLRGVPDQLFDKFFIKQTCKEVREYKYTRHNTLDPNYKPRKKLEVPNKQEATKLHINNAKTNDNENVTDEVTGQKIEKECTIKDTNAIEGETTNVVVETTETQKADNESSTTTSQNKTQYTKKQSPSQIQGTKKQANRRNIANSTFKSTKHTIKQSVSDSVTKESLDEKKQQSTSSINPKSSFNLVDDKSFNPNSEIISKDDEFKNESNIQPKKLETLKTLTLYKVNTIILAKSINIEKLQIKDDGTYQCQQTIYHTRKKRYDYKELLKDDLVSDDEDEFVYYTKRRTAEEKAKESKDGENENNSAKTSIKDIISKKSRKHFMTGVKRKKAKRSKASKTKGIKEDKPKREYFKSKVLPDSHQCYVCFKLFDNKEKLIDHCKDHFDVCNITTMKKCPLCDYVSRNALPRHMRLVHDINISNKYSMTKMKCKKDDSGGNRFYIESKDAAFKEIEVIPSVKNLNNRTSMNIDKKKREENNKLIAKVKLVKKKEWVVEKEKLNVEDVLVPNDNMKDTFKDNNEYIEKMRKLYQAAKKEAKIMMFPCRQCEKICQSLAALKAHFRKHDPNKKPYAPKVYKCKRKKLPDGGLDQDADNHDKSAADNASTSSNVAETEENANELVDGSKKSRKKGTPTVTRNDKPKEIVNNHKCAPELKSFYENCIRGGDIEFWQFLKIYNKMGRENVKDFEDLEKRTDNTFGCHSLEQTNIESSSKECLEQDANYKNQEQMKSNTGKTTTKAKNINTKGPDTENLKDKQLGVESKAITSSNNKNIKTNVTNTKTKLPTSSIGESNSLKVNESMIKKRAIRMGGNRFKRVVNISKKEYLKRQALKDMLRKNISQMKHNT